MGGHPHAFSLASLRAIPDSFDVHPNVLPEDVAHAPYAVADPGLPAREARDLVQRLPRDAAVLMRWKRLYTLHYIASVEGVRRDLRFHEVSAPVVDVLRATLIDAALAERPVFAFDLMPADRDALARYYRLEPAGPDLLRVRPR